MDSVPGSNTNQLHTAAAEIGDNSIRIRNPGEHSGGGEPRLLRPVDYLDLHAALAFDLGGKSLSVAGVAHGSGCQHREMIDGNGAGESDEAAQIDQRQGDPFRVQPAGRGDTAPEAAHDLLVEQRKHRGAEPLENDEAQRVRAEIDDADALGRRKRIGIEHPVSARQASGALASAPCRARTGSDSS